MGEEEQRARSFPQGQDYKDDNKNSKNSKQQKQTQQQTTTTNNNNKQQQQTTATTTKGVRSNVSRLLPTTSAWHNIQRTATPKNYTTIHVEVLLLCSKHG